jgi:hypothetical protein
MLFQRALEQREAGYNAEKYRRQAMRWDRYPVLMRKMLETRKPLTRGIEPDTIQWPTFAEDPLWRVFKYGKPFDDPYNALLVAMDRQGYEQALASGGGEQWLSDHRWRGKRAFLALAYGSQAETLAPQLDWTVEKTGQAIKNLEEEYATLPPMRMLTQLELVHLGGVRTLAGRPRRVNGYWQLTHPEPVTVSFYRMRPNPRTYIARIVPLGTTRMGVQAFIEECCVELDGGTKGELVLEGKSDGTVAYISRGDPFVRADHFNVPPFRNINYNQINWVRDADGLVRHLSEQARGFRQAFNAMCQGTGADHLRWIMNNVDSEVVTKPAFRDCHLVLTIHDSLMYEVPEAKVKSFIEAIGPVVTRRPSWADIDIKAKFEVGHSAGQMKEFTIP